VDAHGPAVRKLVAETGVDLSAVAASGKGGRATKGDVLAHLAGAGVQGARPEQRVPMTRIRTRIAERLKDVQNTAAILTTFNEVNMQPVMDLRKKYQDVFTKKHGVKLGFMSFFVKAATEALKAYPVINASVDGKDIVYHGYFDVGIAVATERGLVVPILRDTDRMSLADIEKQIAAYGEKARANKISLDDMQGGTFSITNGGIFGSMLSTPILNAPQSAILGMHNIVERPVAENGQVVIRPVMYLALSYDHRIIDGAEAVQFLVKVRDALQDPARMLLEV
jgi:2-oxoglutarate dehydrogenase E2 component (dihydrolipoamide succinyltransferase)